MKIPTLSTDQLFLLPPSAAHEDLYQRFYADAEASRNYGGPLTPRQASDRLASDLGTWSIKGFGVWVIQRKNEGDLLGVCGFWQGFGWPRELTWWLRPGARGAGFAQEASRAAIEHAYNSFGWNAVETYMMDENTPAKHLVLRLGGIKTNRHVFPDGRERDVYRLPRAAA